MERARKVLRGRWLEYVIPRQVPVTLMGTKCEEWVLGTTQHPITIYTYKN
jgi:hypothetical protein